jgi:hypothetical protein
METFKITKVFYNADADELDLVINYPEPQPARSVLIADDFYLRINPDTNAIVGATIFNASYYFVELSEAFAALSEAFAAQCFDDPTVRRSLEQCVAELAARLQPA